MAQVTLRNTSQYQPFVGVMYHEVVCRRRGSCSCTIQRKPGPSGKLVAIKQPQGFQINAKSELAVDEAVLHLPTIKKARRKGWLEKLSSDGKSVEHAVISGSTAKAALNKIAEKAAKEKVVSKPAVEDAIEATEDMIEATIETKTPKKGRR